MPGGWRKRTSAEAEHWKQERVSWSKASAKRDGIEYVPENLVAPDIWDPKLPEQEVTEWEEVTYEEYKEQLREQVAKRAQNPVAEELKVTPVSEEPVAGEQEAEPQTDKDFRVIPTFTTAAERKKRAEEYEKANPTPPPDVMLELSEEEKKIADKRTKSIDDIRKKEEPAYNVSPKETEAMAEKQLKKADGSLRSYRLPPLIQVFQSLMVVASCFLETQLRPGDRPREEKHRLREVAIYKETAFPHNWGVRRYYVYGDDEDYVDAKYKWPSKTEMNKLKLHTPTRVVTRKQALQEIRTEAEAGTWTSRSTAIRKRARLLITVVDDMTAELVKQALMPKGEWEVNRCELLKLQNGYITQEKIKQNAKNLKRAPENSIEGCYVPHHRGDNMECAIHQVRAIATWLRLEGIWKGWNIPTMGAALSNFKEKMNELRGKNELPKGVVSEDAAASSSSNVSEIESQRPRGTSSSEIESQRTSESSAKPSQSSSSTSSQRPTATSNATSSRSAPRKESDNDEQKRRSNKRAASPIIIESDSDRSRSPRRDDPVRRRRDDPVRRRRYSPVASRPLTEREKRELAKPSIGPDPQSHDDREARKRSDSRDRRSSHHSGSSNRERSPRRHFEDSSSRSSRHQDEGSSSRHVSCSSSSSSSSRHVPSSSSSTRSSNYAPSRDVSSSSNSSNNYVPTKDISSSSSSKPTVMATTRTIPKLNVRDPEAQSASIPTSAAAPVMKPQANRNLKFTEKNSIRVTMCRVPISRNQYAQVEVPIRNRPRVAVGCRSTMRLEVEHQGLLTMTLTYKGKTTRMYYTEGMESATVFFKWSSQLRVNEEIRGRLVMDEAGEDLQVISAISFKLTETREEADMSEHEEVRSFKAAKSTGSWAYWSETEAATARRLAKKQARYTASATRARLLASNEWKSNLNNNVWTRAEQQDDDLKWIWDTNSRSKPLKLKMHQQAKHLKSEAMFMAQESSPSEGRPHIVYDLWQAPGVWDIESNPKPSQWAGLPLFAEMWVRPRPPPEFAAKLISAGLDAMEVHHIPTLGAKSWVMMTTMHYATKTPAMTLEKLRPTRPWMVIMQLWGDTKLTVRRRGLKIETNPVKLKEGEALVLPGDLSVHMSCEPAGHCVTAMVGCIDKYPDIPPSLREVITVEEATAVQRPAADETKVARAPEITPQPSRLQVIEEVKEARAHQAEQPADESANSVLRELEAGADMLD